MNPSQGMVCLSSYGAAALVGVGVDDALGCAAPIWHPFGAFAAQLAPLFHAVKTLDVGRVVIDPSGPVPSSTLLQPAQLSRYISVDEESLGFDTTSWLNEGLFGRRVGKAPFRELEVLGVRWEEKKNVLVQVARDAVGGTHLLW
jgi:hypothetical protein